MKPESFLILRINYGLEVLWLLAVFLVPLTFLDKNYAVSEAIISYVEIPKVALLRTLAGLTAILWLFEWAIRSRLFHGISSSDLTVHIARSLRFAAILPALISWLKVHPTHWLTLSAGVFFGFTFLTTLLSGSFTNSLWGEIPGQDGYSAYTIASYAILFGAISTHMKGRAQLVRLLSAIVLMGVMVGLYGTLQHYGHDFLNATESSGGGSARVTVFMGNAIFAAAVLSMTVPITMVAAAISLHYDYFWDQGIFCRIGRLGQNSILTSLWALVLAVQLLGLMFTFSRGPWAGTVLALVAFLVLLALSSGWRMLVQAGLVIGLAGILAFAFLHWRGSVTIIDSGPWFGIALGLAGLVSAFIVLFLIKNFSRAIILIAAFGIAVTIVGTAVLAPSALSGRGNADSTVPSTTSPSTASQVIGRITSAKTEVLGGFTGGRGEHWKISQDLITERPWFEFDNLSLPWLRPLIGYGPDLFRYTYLLKSPAGGLDFMPMEPDHAHNFFIHQTVEQGIFGGLAALGLFFSVFGIAGHHLLRRLQSSNSLYQIVLLGLAAIILGRFLEMMVGVARISDLTILWAIFGLFAASASLDNQNPEHAHQISNPSAPKTGRKDRRRPRKTSRETSFSRDLMVRLAIVAWLVGGIGIITWQNGINPVRASIAEGRAIKSYQQGNMDRTVRGLDNAIKWAPGIPNYYKNQADVFLAYQLHPDAFTEPNCEQQNENPYLVCLGLKSLNSNLESVARQPFNFMARLAAGNSATNLGLTDLAIEAYSAATDLVPNAYDIRNDLAESQIAAGLYNEALTELEQSLGITGESGNSTRAFFLKGKALKELGRLEQASENLRHGLTINYGSPYAKDSMKLLSAIDTERGFFSAIESYSQNINQNPKDAVSYYLRGQANLTLGENENAISDITKSMNLGLDLNIVAASRVYAVFKSGGADDGTIKAMTEFAAEEPWNAWILTYLGELYASMGQSALALNYLETANGLDPKLGLAHLTRAKIFASMGLNGLAKESLNSSSESGLPTAQDYSDRGEIYAYLGNQKLAFLDLDEAIRINSNSPKYYSSRANAHAYFGNYRSALADLDAAIHRDPDGAEYLINRGVVYDILGNTESSLVNFAGAMNLGKAVSLPPKDPNASYFTIYKEIPSEKLTAKLLLKLEDERQLLKDIEYFSTIPPASPDYPTAIQLRGETYLELKMWQTAADQFSRLLELYPNTPKAYRQRGDAYLELHRYQDAMDNYQKSVILDPSNSDSLAARAKGYSRLGEYDRALKDLTEAIQLGGNESAAYSSRGYLSVQTGAYALAFPDLDKAIEIAPKDHSAYHKKAAAHTGLDQTWQALENLNKAVELAPSNADYLYDRGLLRFELGEYPNAIEDLSEAIALNRGHALMAPQHIKTYIARGTVSLQIGSLDQALSDANTALRLISDIFWTEKWDNRRQEIKTLFASGLELLSEVYRASQKLENAAAEYKRHHAYIDPRHIGPYIDSGMAHLDDRRHGQALADANVAIRFLEDIFQAPEWDDRRHEINILLAASHRLLGDVYVASGQGEHAAAEYRDAEEYQLATGLQ